MKKQLVLFLFLFTAVVSFAQLTGTKTVGGGGSPDYATIALAVADLNAQGVGTGGVIFNVAADHSEPITAPIIITATGTSSNTITFQKSGVGANPLVTRTDAGSISNTTFAAHNDAVIQMNGTDYITFDKINLAASNQGVEFGYYTFKTATDGSQNVTIKNCVITMTKGTSGLVMGIYISNGPTTTATGVTVTSDAGRNRNITIIGNTISNVHTGIYCRGSIAANFYDSLYVIGQSGAGNLIQNFGGGSATTTYGVYFIYVADPFVDFNTINNAGGGGTAHGSTLYGIFYSTVKGVVTGNDNDFTLANSSSASATYYIYNSNTVTSVTFNNNKFAAGTLSSTGTVYLIYASSSTPIVTASGNSTSGTITRTGASGSIYCYYNIGSPANGYETLTNNDFSNISVTGSSSLYGLYSSLTSTTDRVASNNVISNLTGGTGSTYGLYFLSSDTNQVFNNNVYDITAGGTLYGIYFSGTNVSNAYNNNVYNLATSGSTFYGIYNAASGTTNCYKNQVYNLEGTNASQTLYGFYITTGTSNNVYNNFVSDLRAPNSGSINFAGMYVSGGTSINLFYNTIYLNASSSSSSFGSSGIYTSTTPTVELRNNIVVNTSTPGNGSYTAKTIAYRRSSSNLATYSTSSNNNCLYAGGTGDTARVIFFDGGSTLGDQTIGAFKTRVNPSDGASFSENPPFLNVATTPYNLHINTAVATQVESGGSPVTTPVAITDDYDGNTRHASQPDVGADEFSGIGADFTPPGFAYDLLSNTSLTTARTFVATVSDPSGVPTSEPGMPRLYWKKNFGGTYTSAGVPTYLGSEQYQYSFGSGVILGDTVYYYIVARDEAGTPNLGASPSGAGGFSYDPPAASTPPPSPNFYVIVTGYSGNYNIGSSQTHTTLTGLTGIFKAINEGAVAGNITLTIVSDITEPGDFGLDQTNDDGGGIYTITIQPDGTTERLLSGDVASTMIRLNGADRVIIDGRFGGLGKYLRFRNINTSDPTIRIQNGSSNNTIRNCYIESPATSTVDGVINFGSGNNTGNTILNCDIRDRSDVTGRPAVGIYFGNISNDGNTIMNCNIYDFNQYGVYISTGTNTLIDSCNIYMNTSGSTTAYGVYLINALGTRIVKNKIFGLSGGSASSVYAIYYTGSTSRPITCWIENNSISISPTTTGSVAGIHYFASATNSVYINYNSIYVGGTATSGTSYGIWIDDLAADYWQYNNAVHNARTGGSGKHYAVYYDGSAITTLNMNYNDYFANGTSGFLGYWSGDKSTIGDWQTASSKDSNSLGSDPQFNSPSNLTPQLGSPVLAAGVPIAGITTDIINTLRSGSTPSIGSYENGLDVLSPLVAFTPLGNTTSTSARTLTPTITDPSGVPTADPGMPRLYWKINTGGSYTGVTPTYLGSNQYQYSFGSGVVLGDTVYYYFVARDQAGTPNIGSTPGGASGFTYDPPAASTAPASPNYYVIASAITGTVNVGSGETYTSLTNDDAAGLFKAINNGVVTGNVTVLITSNLTESGAVALNQAAEEAMYTISIQPSAAVNRTISGSYAGGLIRLNGADSVTFDGRYSGSGKYLTFINTSTSGTIAAIQLISLGTNAGARGNTIRNCYISTGHNGSGSYGIAIGGAAVGSAGDDNDYNSLISNVISKAYYGIYASGSATGVNDNLSITSNTIGSDSPADYIMFRGIYSAYGTGSTVTLNTVFNLVNSVTNLRGMEFGTGFVSSQVSRNQIYNIEYTATSFSAGKGMTFDPGSGVGSLTIDNNIIYGLKGHGSTTATNNTWGISLLSGNDYKVYYNSINVFTDRTTTSSSDRHGCIYLASGLTSLDIRNNILSFTAQPGNLSTGKVYAIYSLSANTAFTTINYNDYYVSGSLAHVGYIASTDQTTLASWAAASGGDANSIDTNPTFNLNTNLAPQLGSPVLAAGTPVSVTIDFTGASRSGSTPSIGAYENGGDFVGPAISYTAFGNTTSTSNRTLSPVTITDASGVNGTSGTAPRVYFKKYADANVFGGNTSTDNGWKWTESTGSSPFSFTIDYSILLGGSASVGDTIIYFVAAQDLGTPINVSSNPSTGFAATSVSSITSAPDFPNGYKIVGTPLSGTYTVGLSKFNEAIGKGLIPERRTRIVQRNVSLFAEDSPVDPNQSDNSKSDFSAGLLNDLDESQPDKPVTVSKEAVMVDQVQEYYVFLDGDKEYDGQLFAALTAEDVKGVYPTITAAINDINERGVSGPVTFSLVDANYPSETYPLDVYQFSGGSAVNTLTFKPAASITAAIPGSVSQTTATFRFAGVSYVIIDGSNTVGGSTRDLTIDNPSVTGDNTWPSIHFYSDASNNVIKNVKLKSRNPSAASGNIIVAAGSVGSKHNTIDNCEITGHHPDSSRAAVGIYFWSSMMSDSNTIKNCDIHDFDSYGIYLRGAPSTGVKIEKNNFYQTSPSPGTSSVYGIRIDHAKNALFSMNKIYNLSSTATTNTIYGLQYWGASSSDMVVDIVNNFVSIDGSSTKDSATIYGIDLFAFSGNSVNVYNNTVYINGSGITSGSTYALAKRSSFADFRSKNNIVVNARSNSTGTGSHYAAYFSTTTITGAFEMDYNNYYTSGTGGVLGYWTTAKPTLAEWQTASGKDANAVTTSVTFVSGTDLHLSGGSIGNGFLAAAPIAGVSVDIDNETRNAYWPYMGADEVIGSPLALKLTLKALIEGFYTFGYNDTISVFLAKPTAPYTRYNQLKGLTSATGVDFYLPKTNNETSYYVGVKHRSAIETWSASPILTSSFPATYDFTSAQSQAYGSNMVQVAGKWCFYGGDVNQDGVVDISDVALVDIDNLNFVSGYVVSDVTGDQVTDITDVALVDTNNLNFISKITPGGVELGKRVKRPVQQQTQTQDKQ